MQDTTTTTVQPLIDYFDRLIPLSKEEKDLVKAKFHPHLFLKKQFAFNMVMFVSISTLSFADAFVYIR